MSNDGWEFAEQLLGITAEALEERRKAVDRAKVDGESFNMGRGEGRSDVATALRNALGREKFGHLNLDGLLAAVSSAVAGNRDAALEEAVSAIPLTLPTGEYAETVERIRALKSKPALIPEGTMRDLEALGATREQVLAHVSPEPIHDFGWALAQMRAGKKVRRKSWGEVLPPLKLDAHGSIREPDDYPVDALKTDSVLATDWEVVE